jgi:hypothetical protein
LGYWNKIEIHSKSGPRGYTIVNNTNLNKNQILIIYLLKVEAITHYYCGEKKCVYLSIFEILVILCFEVYILK